MKNFLTKKEYGKWNTGVLLEEGFDVGDEFITFKQALKIDGITGKSLKGLKTVATLYALREVESKVTKGKIVKEKFYFRVFYAPDVLARINNNQKVA
tara:strand:+ start:108 stop:398 length:291 start_codon:yes stop_codon:yes gene_type:complete